MEVNAKRGLLIGAGLAVVSVLFLAIVGGAGGWWYYTRSPTYSLAQIQKAIASHDGALFEKHVAVDDVVTGMADQIMAQQMKEAAAKGDQSQAFGAAMAAGFIQMMKPAMAANLKTSARHYVETGEFGDRGRVTFTVEDVHREGKQAIVRVTAHPAQGKPNTFTVRMRDQGGYWQVFGFDLPPDATKKS